MGKRQQQQQPQRVIGNFISSPGLATMTNHYTTTAPAEEIMAAMPPLPVPTATSPTSTNTLSMLPRRQRLGSREAMKPLYDRLLEHSFPDSVSAVEFCRSACAKHGFTVKQEASANKHIYVYCSREGLPDSVRKPRSSPQRKRPSKRCDCRWRVVLSETGPNRWEFRRSLNPNAAEHNHEMMSPDEMVQNWPNEVNEFIIGLARQRMQTHEIRDMVKQQFPSIAWNERRFYNRLTEERKRIRQRDVMDRSQRLLTVSARVCSLVAANEHWSTCVESEFIRLLNHYCRLARTDGKGFVNFNTEVMKVVEDNDIDGGDATGSISSSSLSDDTSQQDEMEDTNDNSSNQEQIQPEPKRQKSLASILSTSSSQQPAVQQKQVTQQQILQSQQQVTDNVLPKGTQTVHVPEYTLFVRLQSQRGSSEGSSSIQRPGRRNNASASTTEQLDVNSLSTTFPLASPGGSSSSSSTSTTLLQHHQYALQQQRSPTSPQQPQSISDVIPSYQQQHIPDHNDGTFATTATVMQQNNSISNNVSTFTSAAYTTSLSGNPVFSSPSSELSFALENSAPSSWEHHHNQHQQTRQQTQQIIHSSNQFDSMVMNPKQQAMLFGYIPSDDHHHHHQQVQQSSMGLSNPLPLQVDNSPDTLNSPSDVNQAHWG
ncbi:hypothetical protein INT45_009153 [Circinella minor]|uniref:FAR1 domain-containing protein n=1 Tax=Circinella minor TaxID=1195481 RepID=A0A8H7SF22_9FUNG|nr:hypothetical protein INT45_009153 [Circinella minor]